MLLDSMAHFKKSPCHHVKSRGQWPWWWLCAIKSESESWSVNLLTEYEPTLSRTCLVMACCVWRLIWIVRCMTGADPEFQKGGLDGMHITGGGTGL